MDMLRDLELTDILIKVLNHIVSPIIAGIICGLMVMWQARKSMQRREFLDQVNFSLNIIQNGQLKMRTLIEKPANEIFINPAVTKLVKKAAQKTSESDPLLTIQNKKDYWLCLNSILNELSEKFAEGFVRMDIGTCQKSETYVVCLTSEVSDNIETRKVRAMLIKKSLLMNFPEEDPQVDYPSHATRIKTLRQLSAAYLKGDQPHRFMELELCA